MDNLDVLTLSYLDIKWIIFAKRLACLQPDGMTAHVSCPIERNREAVVLAITLVSTVSL